MSLLRRILDRLAKKNPFRFPIGLGSIITIRLERTGDDIANKYTYIDAYSDLTGEIQFRQLLSRNIVEVMNASVRQEAINVPIDTEYLRDTIAWFPIVRKPLSFTAHMGALAYYAKYTDNYLSNALSVARSEVAGRKFVVRYRVLIDYVLTVNRGGVPQLLPFQDESISNISYKLADFCTIKYRDTTSNQMIVLNARLPRRGTLLPVVGARTKLTHPRIRAKLAQGYSLGNDRRIDSVFLSNLRGNNVLNEPFRERRRSKYHSPPTPGRRAQEEQSLRGR